MGELEAEAEVEVEVERGSEATTFEWRLQGFRIGKSCRRKEPFAHAG